MKLSKLLLFISLFSNAHLIHAHAVVTDSTLNVESIASEQATQVKLMFNSKIELNLSQVFLVSTGDIKQSVESQSGEKPGQVLINLPPLKPGEYALQLKVFAVDGHLSEDLLRFIVTE